MKFVTQWGGPQVLDTLLIIAIAVHPVFGRKAIFSNTDIDSLIIIILISGSE